MRFLQETYNCASLVPRPRPARLWPRSQAPPSFSVLQATESWAGPGNEDTTVPHSIWHFRYKNSYPIFTVMNIVWTHYIVSAHYVNSPACGLGRQQ